MAAFVSTITMLKHPLGDWDSYWNPMEGWMKWELKIPNESYGPQGNHNSWLQPMFTFCLLGDPLQGLKGLTASLTHQSREFSYPSHTAGHHTQLLLHKSEGDTPMSWCPSGDIKKKWISDKLRLSHNPRLIIWFSTFLFADCIKWFLGTMTQLSVLLVYSNT